MPENHRGATVPDAPPAEPTETAPAVTPATAATPAAPAAPAATPAAPAAPAATTGPTADEMQALRDQLAQEQVKATDRAKAAADKATAELTKSIGKALGLIEDDDKTTPDPAALAQQIAERTAGEKAAKIENAVIREAPKAGGDIDALLDSTAFTKALDKLDPAADDFRAQVAELVRSTVAANPKYAAAPVVPGRSGPDPSAGNSEATGQLTREQLDRMSPTERLKAHKEGRLKHLLGG